MKINVSIAIPDNYHCSFVMWKEKWGTDFIS